MTWTLWRRVLSSPWVWRATGWTLATSIRATRGRFESVASYRQDCVREMAPFAALFDGRPRVLEFGCGVGGNLLAVRERISSGVGVDVNPGYVRHARRLARRTDGAPLEFVTYDGRVLPPLGPPVDLVVALGVLERLPAPTTEQYVAQLRDRLAPGGRLLLSFLTPAARGSRFTQLLGDAAYTFWTDEAVAAMAERQRLVPNARFPVGPMTGPGGATVYAAAAFIFDRDGAGAV